VHFFILKGGEKMLEKIYYFNKGTKTLHIKGLCKNSVGYDYKTYATEQEAIQDNGRYLHMCVECENEKEKIIHDALKNQK
jgi:hypothetical protein